MLSVGVKIHDVVFELMILNKSMFEKYFIFYRKYLPCYRIYLQPRGKRQTVVFETMILLLSLQESEEGVGKEL